MRTVAVDNLEKKRQPMWADAIETVRRIQDEDLMKLALGGGYAPPGPVMFVSKVAAVLAGHRPAWLQFQNIISEKVRERGVRCMLVCAFVLWGVGHASVGGGVRGRWACPAAKHTDTITHAVLPRSSVRVCVREQYVGGIVDMHSVWLRRPNPAFYKIYRYMDPEKVTPEQMEIVQKTIARGDLKLENFHKDTHRRGCGYFVAYAMCKQILALNNYYEIGKFLKPIRARVVTMDLEIKEMRAALQVQEGLLKLARAEEIKLIMINNNYWEKKGKNATDPDAIQRASNSMLKLPEHAKHHEVVLVEEEDDDDDEVARPALEGGVEETKGDVGSDSDDGSVSGSSMGSMASSDAESNAADPLDGDAAAVAGAGDDAGTSDPGKQALVGAADEETVAESGAELAAGVDGAGGEGAGLGPGMDPQPDGGGIAGARAEVAADSSQGADNGAPPVQTDGD